MKLLLVDSSDHELICNGLWHPPIYYEFNIGMNYFNTLPIEIQSFVFEYNLHNQMTFRIYAIIKLEKSKFTEFRDMMIAFQDEMNEKIGHS